MESIYQQNGFKDRYEYLMHLSDMYGIPYDTIRIAADMLGPSEDFDGLITMIEEWEE